MESYQPFPLESENPETAFLEADYEDVVMDVRNHGRT